jgi:hypothetical protein
MMLETGKAVSAYVVTAGLSWVASRYHLDGSQVAAISADVGAVVAAAYGVWAHTNAAKGVGK